MSCHDVLRRWVAEQMGVDVETTDPVVVTYLDEVTGVAEAGYVRSLLALGRYRPLVG
ncbi:hypothetical protein [Rhodococcus opacus]|uniref:hypothetical protein n=1 Tax=Rhodococcus opacus TaxID=37919 RepID=UPI00130E0A43|nr:hypothetical protein [Rhodococcus opacus]